MNYRTQPLVTVLCSLIVALMALSLAEGACNDTAPLRHGSVIHVAVLVWVADAPHGLFRGNLSDTRAADLPYANNFVQPYMLGAELFIKQMRAQGPMPLPDAQSVTINFVYINMANTVIPANVPAPAGTTGFSTKSGQCRSVIPDIPGSFTFPGLPVAGLQPGLASKVISTNPVVLQAHFGIDKPFTFIIPSVLFADAALVALANTVENSLSHIIIHPLLTGRDNFVCDGVVPVDTKTGAPSRTPDCLAPKYNRKRRGGARRFNTLISTFSDASSNQLAALDLFHTLGIRSLVLVRDSVKLGWTLSMYAAKTTADAAAQLNIQVLETFVHEDGLCPGSAQCPPHISGAQLFAEGQTATQVAARIATLNPNALIILAQPGSMASWSIGQLFRAFKQLQWSPQALSWGCGIEGSIAEHLPDGAADLLYTWNSKPWDPELRGPNYQNYRTDTNFELVPAVEAAPGVSGIDGPSMFATLFEVTYGDAAPGGRHPMYTIPLKDNSFAAAGYATMVIVQKMVEAAQSADVGQILNAAKSMAQPGMYGRVALDVYGRTVRVHDVLQQQTPKGLVVLASVAHSKRSPYNIGHPPVFPMPTWAERKFSPVKYSTTGERAVIALTSVCIALCSLLLALVIANYRSPVIRAATPSFCAVSIMGSMFMLTSNFFATLVVNDSQCAASSWLLTTGFTLTFAALFIKTFRIWRIFGGRKLQVLKMKDSELLLAVAAFVLVDIIINAAWHGTIGMRAVRVHVDLDRPAFDYWQCDYSSSMVPVIAHLSLKGGLLLFGVALTYSVRNTPSQFNESTLIGLAIYNTTFVISFIVPVLAVGLGGRETTFQLRAYAIIFVCMSSCGLLYIPKLLVLRKGNAGNAGNASLNATVVGTDLATKSIGDAVLGKDEPVSIAMVQHVRNASMPRSGVRQGGVSRAIGPRLAISHYTSQASSIGMPARSPSPMSPSGASAREVGPLFVSPDVAAHLVNVQQAQPTQPGAVNMESKEDEMDVQGAPHVDAAFAHA